MGGYVAHDAVAEAPGATLEPSKTARSLSWRPLAVADEHAFAVPMFVELDEIAGAVVVVNKRGVRIRRAPSS